jgi:hypothetical protein
MAGAEDDPTRKIAKKHRGPCQNLSMSRVYSTRSSETSPVQAHRLPAQPQPSHIPQLNPKRQATDLKAPSECSFRRRRNLTEPSPCAHTPLKPSSDQLSIWRISTFCYFFVVFFFVFFTSRWFVIAKIVSMI